MTIDIGRLVMDGFERTIARNGLLFAAIFYALSLVSGVLSADLTRELGTTGPTMSPAPTLGLSPLIAGLLVIVLGIVSAVVTVGAIRTFVTEETETIPTEHFTRNIVLTLVNLLVGGILFGLAVGIGFVFLIVPGLFLLVSLFFWNYYVIVDDENFVEGFQRSWAATSGNRLKLFGLGVVVVVIGLVVNLVSAIPGIVLPGVAAFLVTHLGSTVTQVFGIATGARAFVQLTNTEREPAPASRQEHAVE